MHLLCWASTIIATVVNAQDTPADPSIWPNAQRRANSDSWLIANHDRLRQIRPRLLVINFANGLTEDKGHAQVNELMAAMQESSRYHGYEDKNALPFLIYELVKYVDLQDQPLPADPLDGNSTRYPRVPNWKDGINFQYKRLFDDEFAKHFGFPDPKNNQRMLPLAELVELGLVHEVWFLAQQRNLGAPFECVEVKQAYDENLHKLPGKSVQAGNGGDPDQPFINRSLRITFLNAERGPGCAMESLGHGLEYCARSRAIPYLTKYFTEYAGFDLDQRYGLPFSSFYEVDARGRGEFLAYHNKTTLHWWHAGKEGSVTNYVATGGNVHFPPNARAHYDKSNPAVVPSTIEHWRRHDGPGKKDRTVEFNSQRCIEPNEKIAGDCMGAWLVYWRQNMPNVHSPSLDDAGKPMKNWWPFLFY